MSIEYELYWQARKEATDEAARYAFKVYDRIMDRLGDRDKAGKTANKVYRKMVERAGYSVEI